MVFRWEMMPRILALRWLVVHSGWYYGRSVEPVLKLAGFWRGTVDGTFFHSEYLRAAKLETKGQSSHELSCIIRAELSKAIIKAPFKFVRAAIAMVLSAQRLVSISSVVGTNGNAGQEYGRQGVHAAVSDNDWSQSAAK